MRAITRDLARAVGRRHGAPYGCGSRMTVLHGFEVE